MKTYRIEVVHEVSKHAITLIEASSEKEAIEKARALEWKEFDQTAASNQTQWKVYNERSILKSFFAMFS